MDMQGQFVRIQASNQLLKLEILLGGILLLWMGFIVIQNYQQPRRQKGFSLLLLTTRWKKILASILAGLLTFGCAVDAFMILSPPPKYPHRPPAEVRQEGKQISEALETYVQNWLQGKVPAKIPQDILPPGINFKDTKNFYLQRYEDIRPQTQWVYRPAQDIDPENVYLGVPDPHATYLKLGAALAPFGSKLVIEGEFPHSRFFNAQITTSLDGQNYTFNRELGAAEVSIVDADIDPLPGNVNPFRVGADRNAPNRKYRLTFDLAIGNAANLNSAHRFPYRGRGNNRVGGLIVYQGPWGKKYGKGSWNVGEIWLRYYGPDLSQGALGGVPLPKAYYVLPTGERYYINCDYSAFEKRVNTPLTPKATKAKKPEKRFGADVGWFKSFGILSSIGEGTFQSLKQDNSRAKQYIRRLDLGVTGRGEDRPAPGNYEPHATTLNHNTYLGREMALEKGKIMVLTGKMPTFPNTRTGNTVMSKAQLRYWSITGYDLNPFSKTVGCPLNSMMDDEIVLDQQRHYVMVYSRPEDRPTNATSSNGATWINWGPISQLGFMIRWMSVGPEWIMNPNPHEESLRWAKAAWSGSQYDSQLIGKNTHSGFLGEYQPKVHYMDKADFEQLGNDFNFKTIPGWRKT